MNEIFFNFCQNAMVAVTGRWSDADGAFTIEAS